jgi:hypothetical protein
LCAKMFPKKKVPSIHPLRVHCAGV